MIMPMIIVTFSS